MNSGFDIKRIAGDGYLIVPLSMSRLANPPPPEKCYEIFDYFLGKFETLSNDVVLLYTNGLYMNSDDASLELRKKMNGQALNHAVALRNLIHKSKDFIPNAFHFLPIDYPILNAPQYTSYLAKLRKAEQSDAAFRDALMHDMAGREYNDANISFLLEEIVITHILRQRLVELPRTLVHNDNWRLVVYPGQPLTSDKYQWQHGLLPQTDKSNPYAGGQYDFEQKAYIDFSA